MSVAEKMAERLNLKSKPPERITQKEWMDRLGKTMMSEKTLETMFPLTKPSTPGRKK